MDIKKINIMGEEWEIIKKNQDEAKGDYILENCGDGYCDATIKTIVTLKAVAEKDALKNIDVYNKTTLRHEIIHAFLDESGLKQNSDWARNEEMIDWFANQLPKIFKIYKELNLL